jgi:hypothetical protein
METSKGSDTLEARARKFLEALNWRFDPRDDEAEDLPKECADFARTVAREMIAELRKEAEHLRQLEAELIELGNLPRITSTVTGCADVVERIAVKFESSPRYGAGKGE